MVTKEPRVYYWLKVRCLFRNLITGREALMIGYSTPTASKERWEKLPILREEAIDDNRMGLKIYLDICPFGKKEPKLGWVLVEILDEVWQKL